LAGRRAAIEALTADVIDGIATTGIQSAAVVTTWALVTVEVAG
jgi:hypothetical protein